MDLKGINVLVDGYNLELQHGTGIKTYGLTLIEALNYLNANVFMLSSRSSSSRDPLLNEIIFFDYHHKDKNDKLSLIKTVIELLVGSKVETVHFSGKVIKDSAYYELYKHLTGVFQKSECYRAANNLFKITGMVSKLKVPQINIWHATYPLPIEIKKAKRITTIHDLIPLRMPYTTLDNKVIFYKSIKESLRSSDLIIAVSETTKNDILDFFDCNPDKIYITYQPIKLSNLSPEEDRIPRFLKRYGLKSKNYILFIGAIEPKKNVGRLIDAYVTIDTEMPLVIVGKKAWLWEGEIGKCEFLFGKDFLKRVKLVEYFPIEDLRYLYAGAYCFVFPSLYEGFGLPPLEAMTFGCPVITSNVASLPEVCGDAALYINPYDIIDIKNKIEKLLNCPSLRDNLSKAGRERAKLFSMENYVKRLCAAYRKVL